MSIASRGGSAWMVVIAAAAVLAGCRTGTAALSDGDRDAIRELDASYVEAWLAGDTAGVLGTLTDDVVLMPGGQTPIEGRNAARQFWWPNDGSRTTITSYSASIDEIGGTATLAFARGRSELAFTYERDTVRSTGSSRTMTFTVVARQPDGTWKIARRMWAPMATDS